LGFCAILAITVKSHSKAAQAALPSPGPSRKWLFRIVALLVIPLLALALVEAGLRLAGYGYPTSFFQKGRLNGRGVLVNNENFSLRFFPPELSRWPGHIMIEPVKPPRTCRVFIFGESAAEGDPQPSFGAGRYLEVLLRERYPGVNFEVVNTGITAINSHVILPIARECAHYHGDLWIIYMGNNEMIGPFGAATVFSSKAPPWPVVRLGLAIQRTRVGQLLMNLERKWNRKSNSGALGVWHGLEMFVGNQLAPDDPRKEVVYKNFRRNLQDIVRAGRNSGAAVVLSTVAVNLKDCPPFASLASSNLPPAEREKFDHLLADGRRAETNGNWTAAAADFEESLGLDPQMAEAQYRDGACLLRLNETNAAAAHFQTACDCDVLPFRANSRINGIIRQTAQEEAGPGMALCDAAASLPEPGAIPGEDTFYEHVHFNFDGNYRLALLWAKQAEGLLSDNMRARAQGDWASQRVCEARLGLTDWNRSIVLNWARERMARPPLNTQPNNPERVADLTARINFLVRRRDPQSAAEARSLYTAAIAHNPNDYILHQNYGEFLVLTGDLRQALVEWRQAEELMPRNPLAFLTEGRVFEMLGDLSSAAESIRHALDLRPGFSEAWLELGKVSDAEGKLDEAVQQYHQSEALQPDDALPYLYMGKALAVLKRTDESIQSFRRAIELNGGNWEAHYALGEVLAMQGRLTEAMEEFQKVIFLQPRFPTVHLNLGIAFLKLNEAENAREQFVETLRLDPNNKLARDYLAAATK
jgi:tetratricopeptide (TPR) repeat protein